MKSYSINKNRTLWFNRVDWLRVFIFFVTLFLIFFIFFHFIISSPNMLEREFVTSLLLSYIISLGLIMSYSIENRINIYIEKDKKIYVLFPHKLGNEYENTVISYNNFKKLVSTKENVEVILKDIENLEGIDLAEIIKVEKIKKYNKNFKFKAKAKIKEWTPKGGLFTIKSYILENKIKSINFIVPTDYENHEELFKILENK